MKRTIALCLAACLLAGLGGCAVSKPAAGGPQFATAAATSPSPHERGEPLFVFAAIGDAHIVDDRVSPGFDNRGYLTAASVAQDLLANCVSDINGHEPKVDFTMVLGDISDRGKAWELNRAASILRKLDAPYYPIVGNHDNFLDDNKAAWKKAFGYDSTHYVFGHKGFKFIVIDPTMDPYDPPDHIVAYDERTIASVRNELARDPEMPTFFINHYNLVNACWTAQFQIFTKVGQKCVVGVAGSAADSSGGEPEQYYRVRDGGEAMRTVLETNGRVVACINGHVHANRIETMNGITHVSIGATLIGRPSVRYFYVYPDRVEIDYEYISDKALFDHVSGMCPMCLQCTDPASVCDFIDGQVSDKRATVRF